MTSDFNKSEMLIELLIKFRRWEKIAECYDLESLIYDYEEYLKIDPNITVTNYIIQNWETIKEDIVWKD